MQQCVDACRSVTSPEFVVVSIATLDTKAELVGAVAREFGVPLTLWTAAQLNDVEVPNPSTRVLDEVGSPSVAEAAAVRAGGGRLLVGKTIVGSVTVALACAID